MSKSPKSRLKSWAQVSAMAVVGATLAGAGAAKDVVKSPAPRKEHPFETLYTFAGNAGDNGLPFAGLVADKSGNLYGAAAGQSNLKGACFSYGSIFKLGASGELQTLHAFNGADGDYPIGGVVRDRKGDIYGTTQASVDSDGKVRWGEVFKIAADGTFSILHTFTGGADGGHPSSALVRDEAGSFYGTTEGGGVDCDGTQQGCGTVFKITPRGTEKAVYTFKGGNDGAYPQSALLADASGNFYGTATGGGANGDGVVFKLAPNGKQTVLHAFNGDDGRAPLGGLVADGSGNLYGTTAVGGASDDGVVFKISADGTETVLHSFTGGEDGAVPENTLIVDRNGNLYGTTNQGGIAGLGVIFKLSPDGVYKTIYAFQGGADGASPSFGSLLLRKGYLYGTATFGAEHSCSYGPGFGVVFRVKK